MLTKKEFENINPDDPRLSLSIREYIKAIREVQEKADEYQKAVEKVKELETLHDFEELLKPREK